jgi:hypothetical protein
MRNLLAALILALSLSGCALFQPEPWAKQIFAPSSMTDQRSCDRGTQRGKSKQTLDDFGRVKFTAKQGDLLFTTRGSKLHLLCYALGLIVGRGSEEFDPIFRTDIRIEASGVKRENIKVEVSLEREGNEIARLTESETETEDNDKTWYSFRRLNQNQLAALEQTTSFTIVINRGLGEERYAVNPTILLGL